MSKNIQKRWALKVIAGIISIILAVVVAVVIRDSIAMRSPDSAIPHLRVMYYREYMPSEDIVVGSYSWRFLLHAEEWAFPQEDLINQVRYVPILPNAPLQLEFSFPCDDFKLSLSKDGGEFAPLTPVDSEMLAGVHNITKDGYFLSPSSPGHYVYQVEAHWGYRGSVLYYLKIVINEE